MSRFLIVAMIVATLIFALGSPHPRPATANPSIAQPLILEQNQGEVRAWRPLPIETGAVRKTAIFTLKVDGRNGGSPDLFFGTEIMPPGAKIRYHRHLHEDEILYIGSGVAYVHVGSLASDAHTGAIVFIPRDTWVSVKNVGKTPISLLFAFNAPDFDRYMRCESVPQGQPVLPLPDRENRQCEKLGDVQYR